MANDASRYFRHFGFRMNQYPSFVCVLVFKPLFLHGSASQVPCLLGDFYDDSRRAAALRYTVDYSSFTEAKSSTSLENQPASLTDNIYSIGL